MKKVLSIVMTLAILLGCFGYSAYATNGKVAKTVPSKSQSITVKAPQESKSNNSDVAQTVDPVERRRQILAKRESDIKANEERAAYISQKIAENGGKFWVDEHGNTHFMNTNRISDDSQLTEEQLASNTSDLLNLVLESKKLFSAIITSGDSTLSGVYDRTVESFNGLQELERREDATEVILQKYIDEYTFVKDNNVDYYSSHLCELKLMLKQEIFALFLTTDGKSTVEAINAGTY